MASFEASGRYNIKVEHERGNTKAMIIQRHAKSSVSGSYGGDEVGAGGLSGFSEPSSPRPVRTEEPPTPLNSVVVTADVALARLAFIDASPRTIRRLLQSAVAETANEMEEESRTPSPETEADNT